MFDDCSRQDDIEPAIPGMDLVGRRIDDLHLALEPVPGIPEAVSQRTMTVSLELPDPGRPVFMIKRIAKRNPLEFVGPAGVQGGNASSGCLGRKGEKTGGSAYIKHCL